MKMDKECCGVLVRTTNMKPLVVRDNNGTLKLVNNGLRSISSAP
jgi:hypothetical protein